MYKVFFNDRKVFLTDDFSANFQEKYGLFYKLISSEDLKELLSFYGKLKTIDTLYLFHKEMDVLRSTFQSCFTVVHAAGGLVRNNKGEYLLIFRRGKWDLPKGKLDAGETIEAAAVREVEEECGISGVELRQPLLSTYHTYPLNNGEALKKTSWFEMHYYGSEIPLPQQEEDITEVRWVEGKFLNDLLRNTYPAIRDVFVYYGIK